MNGFNLSTWALNHQALVRFFIVALMLSGVQAYFALGQAEDPPFTFRTMVVRAFWPGATAREVERQVLDRLEKKLQEVPHLDVLRSYAKPGEATIFVNLNENTPPKSVADIWYQVRKKINDVRFQLPSGVQGPFFNDEFGDTFGSIYAFTSDGFSYAELKEYVDLARQELLRLPNVSKVDLVGEQAERIYIEFSTRRLQSFGIDPQLFIATLQEQNSMAPAGTVVTDSDNVALRVSGDFQSVASIRDIGFRANNRTFRLGDISKVYRGYVDPTEFKMRFQGQETLGLAISMTQGGNVIQMGRDLDAAIKRFRSQLPIGVDIHAVSDQPKVVEHSVKTFMQSLTEAVAIVLAVSFLSLGWRTGIVVALSIPLVLAVTFTIMNLGHIDLHRISLGSLIIALGLLVDDAIIAVEMMYLKLEEGMDRIKAASFAYTSTAMPMLSGTLITMTGFLPIGTAQSSVGEYTFAIFGVTAIALSVSWLVAVVFTPYLGYLLLPSPKPGHVHQDTHQGRFYRVFRKLVTGCITYRKTVIVATVLAFAASIYGFRFVPNQFFPASERPELLVDFWLAEGSSFAATEAEVRRLEKLLDGDPNMLNYVAYIGAGSPRFYLPLDQQLSNLNYAQVVIMTKGGDHREALLQKLRAAFTQDFPLLRARAQRLENGPPVGYPIQFRVVGEDPLVIRDIANQVAEIMRNNANCREVNFDWKELSKVVKLEVDQDKARALGITSLQLSNIQNAIFEGLTITQYREGDKLIPIVARAEPRERVNLGSLKDLDIFTGAGRSVPLSQIARIAYGFEEGVIWRRNRLPTITVRADIPDGVQAPDVTNAILPQLKIIQDKLPPGYRIETGGALESSGKGQSSIAAGFPLMIGIMLTVLMFQLQSFQKTVLVLLTAPLGIIGVVLALLLTQRPVGFVALLGIISLAGMIMRNAVILVDQIDQDVKAGENLWDAIVESTVRRFRPIMLTAAAAILAMIPLSRSVFWGPMATAIMGGLLVATVLTCLFLPALYAAWFRVHPTALSRNSSLAASSRSNAALRARPPA